MKTYFIGMLFTVGMLGMTISIDDAGGYCAFHKKHVPFTVTKDDQVWALLAMSVLWPTTLGAAAKLEMERLQTYCEDPNALAPLP